MTYNYEDYSDRQYESCYSGEFLNGYGNIFTVCFENKLTALIHIHYPNKNKDGTRRSNPANCSQNARFSEKGKLTTIIGSLGKCDHGRKVHDFDMECERDSEKLNCNGSMNNGEETFQITMYRIEHNKYIQYAPAAPDRRTAGR